MVVRIQGLIRGTQRKPQTTLGYYFNPRPYRFCCNATETTSCRAKLLWANSDQQILEALVPKWQPAIQQHEGSQMTVTCSYLNTYGRT